MEIKFENGSKITTIETQEESIRSKRYSEFISYYRTNPYKFCRDMYPIKLYWYQKVMLWFSCQFNKSKKFLT